MKGKHTLLMV